MRQRVARVQSFLEEVAREIERVLPRPLVPLLASLGIHLALLPLVYLVILFDPEPDTTSVFLLEGGVALGDGIEAGTGSDEEEAGEDLLGEDDDEDEDDWDDEAVDTSDSSKFDQWGFPLPGAFDGEEDDDDEDWDTGWLTRKHDDDEDDSDLVDEDLDEEMDEVLDSGNVDMVHVSEYDIEMEEEPDEAEIEEQIEKIGTGARKWDEIFAGTPGEGGKAPGLEPGKGAAMDAEILSLISKNPYEDLASGNDEPRDALSGTDLSAYDARLPELLDWVPPDSLMAALVSLDLLRARPDREELERTFKSLGYFRQIAGGSDLEFFDDVDAVLIATSDPLDVAETFVILRTGLEDDGVRQAIDRQFKSLKLKPSWYEIGGRSVAQADKESFDKLPWIYFIPRPGYVAVLHVSKRDRIVSYMGSDSFGPGADARLVGDLERHMRLSLIAPMIEDGLLDIDGGQLADEPDPVAVVLGSVMFQDAFKSVVDGSAFPSPESVFLMGRFGETGGIAIEGAADFADDASADGFLAQWKKVVDPLRKNKLLKLIGAVDLIDLAGWKRGVHGRVSLEAGVEPDDVPRLMALVRLLTAEPADKLPPPAPEPAKGKKPPKKTK